MTDRIRTRARRAVETNAPAPTTERSLNDLLTDAWAAKVIADEAAATFKQRKEDLLARMKREGKVTHELPALGNRPRIKAKIAAKTTNTIDPTAYAKLVTRDQFASSVSVVATEAKKFVAENALKPITTSKKGDDYVEVKAGGAE